MERILVVGGGTMGAGIAFVAARGGYDVALVEPDARVRAQALERIAKDAARAGDAGIVSRVAALEAMPASDDAGIAIEAVPERIEIKRQVFEALAASLRPDALLATNTSSLSIEEIAAFVSRPERVLGLHFFNPAAAMKLVEIVHGALTSDEAIARAEAFVAAIEKTAVLAADTPGFIVNRVARPYYLQAMRALALGAAAVEELDALARAAGFKMGPFELMDLIGLDVNLATTESVYARTGAARLEPMQMQREMVAQGRLGRKTGVGFYDYSAGAPARIDLAPIAVPDEIDDGESVVVLGFGALADELADSLARRYANVRRIENDDLLYDLPRDATIVVDAGDGTSDRSDALAAIDGDLAAEAVLFADAYSTDVAACAKRLRHPERLVGYGVLGTLEGQGVVEIVDTDEVSDDALALAEELFAAVGKGTLLVENVPGLFLGRVVGSIINEAVIAVQEGVADADDVATAMRLGTNYPIGPIEWGQEIRGARVARILQRLAQAEGPEFAPHRSLWVLDLDDPAEEFPEESSASGV